MILEKFTSGYQWIFMAGSIGNRASMISLFVKDRSDVEVYDPRTGTITSATISSDGTIITITFLAGWSGGFLMTNIGFKSISYSN